MANDIFYEKLKRSNQPTYRKSLARFTIAVLLGIALFISWQKPDDPLPLFLLAGAFGVQLLPALIGLCYCKKLTGPAVRNGAFAGLIGVLATSTIPQGAGEMFGFTLPFDAWPLSLHPAFWGLVANILALSFTGLINLLTSPTQTQKQTLAHQLTYHELPDGKPLMASNSKIWWTIALLVAVFFVLTIALPLGGLRLEHVLPSFMHSLWSWQVLSWIVGLALVYIIAYKLQPIFDPEQALDGSLNPLKRRFRVKAKSRKHV